MPRANRQQHTFSAGELSPLIFGRQDVDRYGRGLTLCFNWIPLVQGGLTRRPGSVFYNTTKFGGTRESRFLPFRYSADLSFMLEFGHQYVRFYSGSGIVTEADKTITDITAADPGVATVGTHGYTTGERLMLSGMPAGYEALEVREVRVGATTTNTFELLDIYGNNIDTSAFGAFSGTATAAKILELATPYEEADVADLKAVQSADVMVLLHPDFAPRQLVRQAALTWAISTIAFIDGPYDSLNDTTTTLTPSGTSGSITLTASATAGINGGDGFSALDVDRLVRILDSAGNWTWLKITAFNSTTSVDADVMGPALASTAARDSWRLGIWSEATGFPRAGGFHENRLFLGGASVYPQRLDGSRSGIFFDFSPSEADGTVTDDRAIGVVMTSDEVNLVQWMETDSKGLLIGTSGGEWLLSSGAPNEPVSPLSSAVRQVTAHGTELGSDVVRVGDAVMFIQRPGRKLRELAFVFEIDGFRAPDLTILAEHITRPALLGPLARTRQPQPVIWFPRTDGALLGLTYERDQDTIAWHRHLLGGGSDANGTPALVESVAEIFNPTAGVDEVWLIVKRYINGRTERYVEVMAKVWEPGDEQDEAFYLDSGFTVVSPGSDTITGLHHLEGETLQVWADGAQVADVTVTDAAVTLPATYDVVTLGLGYLSDAELMPIEAGAADGSAQGKMKTIGRLGIWLMDTLGLKFGSDANHLTKLIFSEWGQLFGSAPAMFTGIVREHFEGDQDRLGQIYLRADTPAPATVLSVIPQVTTEDDT